MLAILFPKSAMHCEISGTKVWIPFKEYNFYCKNFRGERQPESKVVIKRIEFLKHTFLYETTS